MATLWQQYSDKKWIVVRYPFVIGKDDYTKRLLFYVEHTMKSIPMNIDNVDYQMSFIRSDEAGKFLAFLVDKDVKGAINGASDGTISINDYWTIIFRSLKIRITLLTSEFLIWRIDSHIQREKVY